MAGARRGPRSKIERHGAEEVVNKVLRSGGTLREACEASQEFTGETVGQGAMSHHNQRLRASAEKTKTLEVMVDRLLEHDGYYDGADPGEKVAALTRRMLLALAVEAASDIPPEAMARLPPDKLAQMISRLEHTRISGERLRVQYGIAYEKAKEDILAHLEDEMRTRPDLMKQIGELSELAAQKVLAKSEGRGE
jgi:hypothetical protein